MDFPKRIFTTEEVVLANELVKKGYMHRLRVKGSRPFKLKVKDALKLIKTAGFYDFLRTYIRGIVEIDGFTQLREADAKIWTNNYAVENPVDAASLFIQKANHMMEYIRGKMYFGGAAEARSVQKRISFLKSLRDKSRNKEVKEECERLLKIWAESVYF